MNEIPKLIRNGQTAVLVSRGFGAGWSTWADDEEQEFALFHKDIAQAVLDNLPSTDIAALTKGLVKELFGNDAYFYTGGVNGLEVEWVDTGAEFEIKEYDGAEILHAFGQREYFVA